jgi:hypothetical protein
MASTCRRNRLHCKNKCLACKAECTKEHKQEQHVAHTEAQLPVDIVAAYGKQLAIRTDESGKILQWRHLHCAMHVVITSQSTPKLFYWSTLVSTMAPRSPKAVKEMGNKGAIRKTLETTNSHDVASELIYGIQPGIPEHA